MKILISIKNRKAEIHLDRGGKKTDKISFPENNNLSEKLLPAIDEILKKNRLKAEDIKKIKVETDTPGSFTTSRIAKVVGKAWEFSTKYE